MKIDILTLSDRPDLTTYSISRLINCKLDDIISVEGKGDKIVIRAKQSVLNAQNISLIAGAFGKSFADIQENIDA